MDHAVTSNNRVVDGKGSGARRQHSADRLVEMSPIMGNAPTVAVFNHAIDRHALHRAKERLDPADRLNHAPLDGMPTMHGESVEGSLYRFSVPNSRCGEFFAQPFGLLVASDVFFHENSSFLASPLMPRVGCQKVPVKI